MKVYPVYSFNYEEAKSFEKEFDFRFSYDIRVDIIPNDSESYSDNEYWNKVDEITEKLKKHIEEKYSIKLPEKIMFFANDGRDTEFPFMLGIIEVH